MWIKLTKILGLVNYRQPSTSVMCFYTAPLFALPPTPTQICENLQFRQPPRLTDWPLVERFLPHLPGFKERKVHFLEMIVWAAGCRPPYTSYPYQLLVLPVRRLILKLSSVCLSILACEYLVPRSTSHIHFQCCVSYWKIVIVTSLKITNFLYY